MRVRAKARVPLLLLENIEVNHGRLIWPETNVHPRERERGDPKAQLELPTWLAFKSLSASCNLGLSFVSAVPSRRRQHVI